VLDDPSIDTTSRTGKLVMGILALIEFENDIRRERQMDGIAKAKDRGVKFGRKRELTEDRVKEIRDLREAGETVPAIIKRTGFSKASVYGALGSVGREKFKVCSCDKPARPRGVPSDPPTGHLKIKVWVPIFGRSPTQTLFTCKPRR